MNARIQTRERDVLAELLHRVTKNVERVMEHHGIRYWQQHKQRYLIWLQWSRALGLPFEKVVDRIIVEYRRRLRCTGPRLGLSIAALTGPSARQWLERELKSERQIETKTMVKSMVTKQVVKNLRQIRTVDDYARIVNQLRYKSRRLGHRKPHRGSPGWGPPTAEERKNHMQTLDAVLVWWGYE